MGTILEALAVIKGKDATGPAFDQVAAKIGRISRAANALNRDVQKQLNMAHVADRHVSRLERSSRVIGSGVKAAAGAAAAYEGYRGMRAVAAHTARSAADREHEKTRMAAAGMIPGEIKEASALAASISKKYPSMSQTETMDMARNIRSVVGHFDEATKILDPLMKLRVVALGSHPERADALGEDFDKLIKGMEIKGVTQDLGKFNHYLDGMAKALNVFGDTLRPTDYYEMFKYGRAATNALSDDFMLKTAPTLAQELGGSSAGKALSSFHTQFVGGKMSNKAVEMLDQLGLIDPSKVIKTSTGHVKGVMPGGVIGGGYLTPGNEDPYQWVNKVLIPAMKQKGLTSEQINEQLKAISAPPLPKGAKEQEIIAAGASQATTAQMLSIFSTQQERIEKDKHLVEVAKGIEAADLFQQSDPKVIRKSIDAQFDNLLANTSEPAMPLVNKSMNWFASGLGWAAEHAKDRPQDIAGPASWFAAMISAATADGIGAGVAHFTGKGGSFGLSQKVGSLAPILGVMQLADLAFDDDDINRLKRYEATPRYRLDQIKELDDRNEAAGIYGDSAFEAYVKEQTAAKRAALEKEIEGFGYNPAVTQGRYRGVGAPDWTIDDIRKATGLGGPAGNGEPVKAVVEGNATLDATVTVKPTSEFWATVETKISNAINAFRSSGTPSTGTSGSTGRSMPEAGPAP